MTSGDEPCAWPEAEFRDVVTGYMNRPPAVAATAGGRGFTVEFPFGETTSLSQVLGDQSHPSTATDCLCCSAFRSTSSPNPRV